MIQKIFAFEFAYQLNRTSTRLNAIILLLYTFVMNLVTTPGDGVLPNNTFHITAITITGALLWLVMSASIAGEAAARDFQAGIHPITFSLPVTSFDHLAGKFLAAFSVNALLAWCLPIGTFISFYLPGLNDDTLLPFRPLVYFNVYFLIALPNVFIATALQFCLATRSRKIMSAYLASLVLAVFPPLIATGLAQLTGNWKLLTLLDPFGHAGILIGEMGSWSPTEKNTRLVSIFGMTGLNRILWMSLAATFLFFLYKKFKYAIVSKHTRKILTEDRIIIPSIHIPLIKRSFNTSTYIKQSWRIAWDSFKKMAKSPAGMALVSIIAIVSVVFANKILSQFGIPFIPSTNMVIDYLSAPIGNLSSPWVVITLLIMYFTSELAWKDREAGQQDLIDTMPVPEAVLFTGKFIGLSLLISLWMLMLMTTGILMQIKMGYYDFQLNLYFISLFGFQLTDYLLFALLSYSIQAFVNKKYIGYLVMLLVLLFLSFHHDFGIEHPLLIFGSDAGWSLSGMRGFGDNLFAWFAFKTYWIGWSFLIALSAIILLPRGREETIHQRIRNGTARLNKRFKIIAALSTALVLVSGTFLYYQTNVLNEYTSSKHLSFKRAQYEHRYGMYANSLQPQIISTKLEVELYPGKDHIELKGRYLLKNHHDTPLDTIHIGSISGVEPQDIRFNKAAKSLRHDKALVHYIYQLNQPLTPGDSVELTFRIDYAQQGIALHEPKDLITKQSTYFTNYDLLPSIGYQPNRELNDPVIRKKYGLKERPLLPALDDPIARSKPASIDQSAFEAIIGSPLNQRALTTGSLQKSWTTQGRNYVHYKTDRPIGNEFAILCGNYAVKESYWKDVKVLIYYHPDHAYNLARMERSAHASLEYYTNQFGPYPFKQLSIVERPGKEGGATADAGIIYYDEKFAALNPDDTKNGFDLPYYILAHEVAHQWWGLARLSPAHVEGAGVLIEGLAVYSGMQVLAKNYGSTHLNQYVKYLHDAYAMPHSLATASLMNANEAFLYYRKAGLAMHALSVYIGKEKLNTALKELLHQKENDSIHHPTTVDLYNLLNNQTPDSLKYLLDDYFKRNIYHRLKTNKITATPFGKDLWSVTVTIEAEKLEVDATGKEKILPMNDLLQLGFYERNAKDPFYLQLHQVVSGKQSIQLILPKKPASGGIDPNLLMIDLRTDDNVKEVTL